MTRYRAYFYEAAEKIVLFTADSESEAQNELREQMWLEDEPPRCYIEGFEEEPDEVETEEYLIPPGIAALVLVETNGWWDGRRK